MPDAFTTALLSTVTIVFAVGVAYGKLRGELKLISYRIQRIETIVGIKHFADVGDVESRVP